MRMPTASQTDQHGGARLAFIALLFGNLALACGPFLVRNSGVGPVAAGFWRLALALPFLWLLAWAFKQPVHRPRKALIVAIALAAFFFAADLAAWHAGILLTGLLLILLLVVAGLAGFFGWDVYMTQASG